MGLHVIHNLYHIGVSFSFYGQDKRVLLIYICEDTSLLQSGSHSCNVAQIDRPPIHTLEGQTRDLFWRVRLPKHSDSRLMWTHFHGPARKVSCTIGYGPCHFLGPNSVCGHPVGIQLHPDLFFPLSMNLHLGYAINIL